MAFKTQHINSYNVGSELSTVLNNISAREQRKKESEAQLELTRQRNDVDLARLNNTLKQQQKQNSQYEQDRKDKLDLLRAQTLVDSMEPVNTDYTKTVEVDDTSNILTPATHTALPEDWKPKDLKEPKLGKIYDIDEDTESKYKLYQTIQNSDELPEVKRVKIRGLIDPDKLNEEDGLITKVGKYVAKGAVAIDKGLFTTIDYATRPLQTPEGIAHGAVELDKAYKAADKAYAIDDPEADFIAQMEEVGRKKKQNELTQASYKKQQEAYNKAVEIARKKALEKTPMTKPVYGKKTMSVLKDDRTSIIGTATANFNREVDKINSMGLSEIARLKAVRAAAKKRDSYISTYDKAVSDRLASLTALGKKREESKLKRNEKRDEITFKAKTEAKLEADKARIALKKLTKKLEIEGSTPALRRQIKQAELAKTRADIKYKNAQTAKLD